MNYQTKGSMMSKKEHAMSLRRIGRIAVITLYYAYSVVALLAMSRLIDFAFGWMWLSFGLPVLAMVVVTNVVLHLRLFRGQLFTVHTVGVGVVGFVAMAGVRVFSGYYYTSELQIGPSLVFPAVIVATWVFLPAAALLNQSGGTGRSPDATDESPSMPLTSRKPPIKWVIGQYLVFTPIFGLIAFMLAGGLDGTYTGFADVVVRIVGLGALILIPTGVIGYWVWHKKLFRGSQYTFHSVGHAIAFVAACQVSFALAPPIQGMGAIFYYFIMGGVIGVVFIGVLGLVAQQWLLDNPKERAESESDDD
jgi:hypothetical protein